MNGNEFLWRDARWGSGGVEGEKEGGSLGDVVMNWPREAGRGAKIC